MTELDLIRAEQARCGDWLREHAAWRESQDQAQRNAYRCALMGARDWTVEELLYLRERGAG